MIIKSINAILVVVMVSKITSVAFAGEDGMAGQPVEHDYTNHLVNESSPYLLSHAHNPVDWYPWGDEALNKAKAEDKPIFLSIGYSACHWCHVMERKSFENEEVAAILNEHFVSIKVDREQRPDLDHIYMTFTTAMTGSGGWPMSVFLTPYLKPFFAGTYFPPVEGYGRPSFMKVIKEITGSYRRDKQAIFQSSEDLYDKIVQRLSMNNANSELSRDHVDLAASELMRNFDHVNGGFGSQPKFPHALELSLFLRHFKSTGDSSYLTATEKALTAMARGGIYDHLGGGFSRYSTDRQWLVPHFEKMLYDNSLLVPVYVEAWQITHNEEYFRVVRETLDWMLREMSNPNGGFYSALDADSEGEEGKFYVWSKAEIESILGPNHAEPFLGYYNVTAAGNFEGHNILHITDVPKGIEKQGNPDEFRKYVKRSREKLFEHRAKRIRPLTDDKILTSWNGLALTALCRGYQVTGEKRYLDAAIRNATFVSEKLWRDGKLTHSYRQEKHANGQFLEDYAYYARGLIDLYQSDLSTQGEKWLMLASNLADTAIVLFLDEDGTFYLRPAGQDDLILRPKDEHDGATPAPGSVMIDNLLKLHRLTDRNIYLHSAEKALAALSGQIAGNPSAMTSGVLALDYRLSDKLEIVLVGDGAERDTMLQELYGRFLPNSIVAVSKNGNSTLPLFEGRQPDESVAIAYVCRNSVCSIPAETVEDLKKQL
ncbi:MAG: thioredoxin domain-containing protein [bacterium]